MLEKREFYINGGWVAPQAGTDLEVIDPSTEEAYAVISLGGQADTDAAVAAARAAFEGWMFTPPAERIALIEKLFEAYMARSDEMAETISREMGAPIEMARAQQAPSGSWHIKNFIRAAKAIEFERVLRGRSASA